MTGGLTRRSLVALTGGGAFSLGVRTALAQPPHISPPGRSELVRSMDVARTPALTYALIADGRVAETAVLGHRRGEEAATAQTYFASASLMKPVFATAVLALVSEGALDLDQPLQHYLPLFEDSRAQKITARHVLSHTSGLPNWNYHPQPLTAAFEPGTQWGYSGEAHFLLLRVVEHVTGKPLGALLDQHVFRPAGMTRSTIDWTDAVAADNAWPHDNGGDLIDDNSTDQHASLSRATYVTQIGSPMSAWTTDVSLRACEAIGEHPYPGNALPNPAFGLWTTAQDYARFLIYAATDSRRASGQIRLRGNLAWGLGWGLELTPNGPLAWQWGDSSGIKNIFMLHLPSRTGLVVFTNGDNGAHVYQRVLRQAFGREFDAFLWV